MKKVTWDDLSWGLKWAMIGGWMSIVSFLIGFLIGFGGI